LLVGLGNLLDSEEQGLKAKNQFVHRNIVPWLSVGMDMKSEYEKRRDEIVWEMCKKWQKTQHKGIPIALMDVLGEAYETGYKDGMEYKLA